MQADWPLVGRTAELEQIARARASDAGVGAVINAPTGVGKSRLAREAFLAAARDGALAEWVQATRSAAAVPLGAFVGLIPDATRDLEALDVLRRAADTLRERSGGRRIVVAVDDAQLLDPVSAALVLHLALTRTAFVIATVRAGEPTPDAIDSLWKDAGAERIELRPLERDDVSELVEAALGGSVEAAALRWFALRAGGNALFLRELVLEAVETGALTQAAGLWRRTGPEPMSRTLAGLVAQRMAGLSAAERAPLELLALGEPLRVDELVGLADEDAVGAIEERGLAVLDVRSDELRLAHPLYGEAVRREVGVLRGVQLRRQVASVIQTRAPLTRGDALRVARLLLDAGAPIPAELRLDAAHAANLAGAPGLAAELAEPLVAAGGGLPAALVLARAYAVSRRFEAAETVLAAVAGDVLPDTDGIEYLTQRAHVLFWGLRRAQEAAEVLNAATGWSDAPGWQRQLKPIRVAYVAILEGHGAAVRTLEESLADDDLSPTTRLTTERRLALALFFTGRTREAAERVRRLQPTSPLDNYGDALALGLWRLIGMETGADPPGFAESMQNTLRAALAVNDREAAGHATLGLGYGHFLAGRLAEAARWYAEAELHFEHADTFGTMIHVRALRVGVDHALGDAAAAHASLERMRSALAGAQPLSSQAPYVYRAEGWAARLRSEAAAVGEFLRGADALRDTMPGYAAQLAYEALRCRARAARPSAELRALARRSDAPLVGAYAAHAEALEARSGGELLLAADGFEQLGATVYALEAATDAAHAFLDEGRMDSARRAAERARALHVPGQGTVPPSVDGLDATPVALTSREAQVTELARRGLSNPEIAERLTLSVRTVETHMYRAMTKLGVSDRHDL